MVIPCPAPNIRGRDEGSLFKKETTRGKVRQKLRLASLFSAHPMRMVVLSAAPKLRGGTKDPSQQDVIATNFLVAIPRGLHPFPSRTR